MTENQDAVITWKYFPYYWSFVRVNHRSPIDSPNKWPVMRTADASCGDYASTSERTPNVYMMTSSYGNIFRETPVIWDAMALIVTSL